MANNEGFVCDLSYLVDWKAIGTEFEFVKISRDFENGIDEIPLKLKNEIEGFITNEISRNLDLGLEYDLNEPCDKGVNLFRGSIYKVKLDFSRDIYFYNFNGLFSSALFIIYVHNHENDTLSLSPIALDSKWQGLFNTIESYDDFISYIDVNFDGKNELIVKNWQHNGTYDGVMAYYYSIKEVDLSCLMGVEEVTLVGSPIYRSVEWLNKRKLYLNVKRSDRGNYSSIDERLLFEVDEDLNTFIYSEGLANDAQYSLQNVIGHGCQNKY